MGGELMPLPERKPAPLLLVQVNCLMVASALSRSGAWTVPRCSPLLRMMRTRQLRRLARVVFLSGGLHVRGPAVLNGICRETGKQDRRLPFNPIGRAPRCPTGGILLPVISG
jgi:hypothetical protein